MADIEIERRDETLYRIDRNFMLAIDYHCTNHKSLHHILPSQIEKILGVDALSLNFQPAEVPYWRIEEALKTVHLSPGMLTAIMTKVCRDEPLKDPDPMASAIAEAWK